jgi:hypothetical protein
VTVHHVLYGLRIAAGARLPALRTIDVAAEPDVRVHVRTPPPAGLLAELGSNMRSEPGYTMTRSSGGDYALFRYEDGTEFTLDRCGRNVWMQWKPPLTLEDATTYLVGPIIGFILRWRGRLCLHASCVQDDGAAFALAGPAGSGKSTTASAFARYGLAVLSDDISALEERDGQFLVHPGYPRTCLWPASAAALYGDTDALPRITPNWDKRHLDLAHEPGGFADQPAPLRAIYLLHGRMKERQHVEISALQPAPAVVSLLANTYGNQRLDQEMRATEFATLDRLIRQVPVRAVVVPYGVDRLPEVCEELIADFRRLREHEPPV